MVVGDVVYPAFLHPYALELFMPLTGLAALATEFIVYGVVYGRVVGRGGLPGLLLAVFGVNIISSVVGVALAFVLPSGLNHEFSAHLTGPAQGPQWVVFATLSWFVALLASIAIEYLVLRLLTLKRPLRGLLATVSIANAASYLVLYVASRVGV